MLKLSKISKNYTTGNFSQNALKDISIEFRKNEFVCILGPSGSGKTTLLNILSGLDRYSKGDLIINNRSTKSFADLEWDAYRNNCIGFIFQNYNLINHISVLDNVEMALTLSGISKTVKRNKAYAVLERVGLKEHAHKKPNQLSGGQMQRVAIARALANDPDIILADEPTGALDSKTSLQIMNLITEIAKDKLVIMVTHNPELANKYANRIVELSDGKIVNDSNPIKKEEKNDKDYHIKKTAMSFKTALSLSFNNIKTKKGRTLLTAFASSIGIIGISLILALSNGFDNQIDIFEADTLSSFPIIISSTAVEMDIDEMKKIRKEALSNDVKEPINKIIPYNIEENTMIHYNNITSDYTKYLKKVDKDLILGISYARSTGLNLINTVDDIIKPINTNNLNLQSLPINFNDDNTSFLDTNYNLLKGEYPKEKTDLVLLLDSKNRIDTLILDALGFDSTKENINFDEVLGKEIKVVMNNDYYNNNGNYYSINNDFVSMNDKKDNITLTIVGVIKSKSDNKLNQIQENMGMNGVGSLICTNELIEEVISLNQDSDIVKAQRDVNYNVLTGETISDETIKKSLLLYLGAEDLPMAIFLYPKDFESKGEILTYLDKYNNDVEEKNKIAYTDMAASVVKMSGDIMDAITYVLIAFSAVSLVVSAIMIGIITYISVLERTKEIGILRSLGARKKDVTRVFNAETFIIGLCSGLLGIGIAWLLIIPANMILESLTNLENVARFAPEHAILMVTISVFITLVGGIIPAKMASNKDPVEALRTE